LPLLWAKLRYVSLSLLGGDDWGILKQPTQVWVGIAALALVVLVGAALLQIWALSQINAALFSTLISWRLVVALIAAWLLLGERLSSVWQIVGAVFVMAAVTAFLADQAFHREPNRRVLKVARRDERRQRTAKPLLPESRIPSGFGIAPALSHLVECPGGRATPAPTAGTGG
jgi:EamA-like transporter family